MNTLSVIQMRAEARQARREIATLRKDLAALEMQLKRANGASNATFAKGIPGLSKWGNQLQWAGRQLQYNFTLPILLAGAAATKWALDNEKATVRIKKVYGDAAHGAQFYSKELDSLGKYFVALSDKMGVQQADVLDVAAAWAAAGSSGVALARATRLTLETMVLGEMDAATATQALIAIQAQYNLSTKELSQTIDQLNMIENQTGISMGGLVLGFERAAGVARTAGIDTRHLGAMLAALVPASGSAANAGNALKTIISRLLSPTKEASQVMELMGMHTKEAAWQSMNGTQRLEAMAKAYDKLNGSQKVVVASTIASRWQINRFDVLMKDLNREQGYYNKSLNSTQSAQQNFNQKVKELNYVLDSSPQRLKQIWVILQNAAADVIQPMIPIILRLASGIARLAEWFQSLSPQVQSTVLGFAVFLAAIGPVARYIGSVANLIGLMTEALHFLGRNLISVGGLIGKVLLSPFKLVYGVLAGVVSAIGSTAGSIGKALVSGLKIIAPLVRSAVMGPLTAIGRMMVTALMPGLIALRVAVVQTLRQLGGAIVTSAAMMGRSLLTIWATMFSSIGAMVAAGGSRLAALWLAMSGRIVATTAIMATNIPRLFTAMWIGIMAGGRRLMVALPLLFSGMLTIVRTGLIAMSAGVARWGASLVVLFSRAVPIIARAFLGPWGLLISAALGIIYHFRDQIPAIWNNVVKAFGQGATGIMRFFKPVAEFFGKAVDYVEKAFWRLPKGVTDALITVVRIVREAALKVYELFSYLNPFAHHSPSLVEQVTAGMAEIKRQYASVGNVGAAFKNAARDLAAYKVLAGQLQQLEWRDTAAEIGKGLPGYLPLFNRLVVDLKTLNVVLAQQGRAVDAQQAIVNKWATALDAANAAVDREQAALDVAKNKLDDLNNAYSAHQQALQNFASAPLKGMQEMNDAIFANEIEQKKLQLQMMDWEKVNGKIDDVRNRLSAMAGDIEGMQAKASDLRAAGAGSDILGPIEAQISAMEQQRSALEKSVQDSPINQMEQQLKDLQDAAARLNLEKDIKFDPMVHEIEKLANAQKELSYDEIVAGIKKEQAAMAALQPQIDAATAAVDKQEAALKQAQSARDAIQATYDAENAKLKTLQDSYDATEKSIRDIESALRDMGSAASDNIAKAQAAADKAKAAKKGAGFDTPGAKNFMDAAGASNFPDVGGTAKQIGREGGVGDQAAQIDQLTKDLQKEVSDAFGKFDMFEPIKKWWNKTWKWVEDNIGSKVQPILDNIKGWVDKIGNPFDGIANSTVGKNVASVFQTILDIGTSVWHGIQNIFKLFAPDVKRIVDAIVEAGKKIWKEIGPELDKFGPVLSKVGDAFKGLWNFVKPAVMIFGVALLGAIKVVAAVFSNVLGPVLDFVIEVIKSVIKAVRGLIEIFVGVFTGDWKMAWQGFKDVIAAIWDTIVAIFEGVGKTLWGIVKGIVQGVVEWFKWLWDVLVGHSIIPDLINSIIDWFKSLPGKVWDAAKSLVDKVVTLAKNAWQGFWDKATEIWNKTIGWLKTLGQSTWNAIINIKDKIVDVAAKAWDAFWTREKQGWTNVLNWLKTLGQATWNAIINMKDKLIDVANTAWSWFWTRSKTGWTNIYNWLKGLPQNAWNGIIAIKDKLAEVGRAAFQALVDKAKAIIDGKGGFFTWIAGIPGRLAKALGGVGSAVANAVKGAWNGAADWLNSNAINALNKVTSKFGFTMPNLPHFAGGGVIPGRVSKKDNTIIAARTGEGVIVPELVKAMGGARGLAAANDAAKRGKIDQLREMGIQAFADGGIIGKVTGLLEKGAGTALGTIFDLGAKGVRKVIPGRPFSEDYLAGNLNNAGKAARKWGDQQDSTGNGVLPGIGWQYQVAALKKQFPNIVITSTTRPGAVTVSGNESYHSLGRAVDMAPDMKYFDWIRKTYGKHTKELIYSPANGRQIKNGQDYLYSGEVRDMHFNHVHWAYDKGGILNPGLTMAMNKTGKGELVLTNDDATRLFNVVSMMDRLMAQSGSGVTPGAAAVSRMTATVTSLEARLKQATADPLATVRGGDQIGTQVNIYGNIEMPNITTADDAEAFINNLKKLAG